MNRNTMDNKSKGTVNFPGKIQNRHLDRSILLKETGSDASVRNTILLIMLVVIGFIVWANVLEISEVASTTGKITHQGDVVDVQHLVGGRVKKIMARNGALVKEGQVLVYLDPIITRLELESIQGKKNLLLARKIRLDALLSGNKPDFDQIENYDIKNAQILLYDNAIKSRDLEIKMVKNKINQVKADLQLQKTEQVKLKKSVALIKEELDIRSKLRSKGLNPRVTLLRLEKEYNEALGTLKQIPGIIRKQKERQKELGNALSGITVTYMEKYSKELEDVNAEISTVVKQISIYDSNIESLEIKAPVEGVVHDSRLKSPGQIVKPGDVFMTLIPTERPLVARVKILSRDIGHIKNGQNAIMRITTYDSRRYGVLKGTVVAVSPSVLIPEDRGEPYYEGIIKLAKDYVGNSPGEMKVFSGMTLTADIKTGSKYFIDYLLKPIYVASQTSFHER